MVDDSTWYGDNQKKKTSMDGDYDNGVVVWAALKQKLKQHMIRLISASFT